MLHVIRTKQFIKSDLATVWNFISSPANLGLITPSFMRFEIIGDNIENQKMYPGQIIEYYVRPVAGIKLHWVTEITQVVEKEYFVDQQLTGPYKLWHHKHFLKEVEGGVEMSDIVHYKAPFGFLGEIMNKLIIEKQLKTIFDYRFKKIEEIFH